MCNTDVHNISQQGKYSTYILYFNTSEKACVLFVLYFVGKRQSCGNYYGRIFSKLNYIELLFSFWNVLRMIKCISTEMIPNYLRRNVRVAKVYLTKLHPTEEYSARKRWGIISVSLFHRQHIFETQRYICIIV